uniref:Peptidase M16 N-terminal domain-containing protein n=1 Tax=Romanomermis culicivorax TaxID=13658 RepID=A0A915L512_ROMCU
MCKMIEIVVNFLIGHVRFNMKPNQSLSKYVKRQIDDVVKSPEDKRLYRGYELANELLVLLISDPLTDKSAASLDVNVGYMCDPVKLPGLAHFCEHMLFMGTKKYPVENDYDNYLSNHGGSSNAYTTAEHTNFFFEVGPDHLDGAIDRFAQFFISPLFEKDAVEREVMAVDSEFQNYIQDDDDRLLQLERTLAKELHPFRKFDCGNRATLFENPRAKHNLDPLEELIKFYNQFYSSNLMRAVIIGKETLDQLAEMCTYMPENQFINIKLFVIELQQIYYNDDFFGSFKNLVFALKNAHRRFIY